MKRLQFNDGSGNLTIREFATMRDGSTLVKYLILRASLSG